MAYDDDRRGGWRDREGMNRRGEERGEGWGREGGRHYGGGGFGGERERGGYRGRDEDYGNDWGVRERERGRFGSDRDHRSDSQRGGGDDRYAGFESDYGGGGGGAEVMGDPSGRGGGTSGFGGEPRPGRRFDRVDPGNVGTQGAHPMSSPDGDAYGGGYGISAGGGAGSSAARYAAMRGGGQHHLDTARLLGDEPRSGGGSGGRGHDPHYSEWRRRQIESLDRDYDEYCHEHRSRFEQEFGSWRERRQGQRRMLGGVSEHMKVVGSDGTHVGTVDSVRDDRIILTRSDENAGGRHHSIPCSWVDRVEDEVRLNIAGEQALRQWRDEEESGAMFGQRFEGNDRERLHGRTIEDQGGGSPHMLNRSFSNTYDRDEDDDRR